MMRASTASRPPLAGYVFDLKPDLSLQHNKVPPHTASQNPGGKGNQTMNGIKLLGCANEHPLSVGRKLSVNYRSGAGYGYEGWSRYSRTTCLNKQYYDAGKDARNYSKIYVRSAHLFRPLLQPQIAGTSMYIIRCRMDLFPNLARSTTLT